MMSAAMSPIANLPISLKIGRILSLSLNIKATVPQIANNGNMIQKNTPESVNWRDQKDLNFHEHGS